MDLFNLTNFLVMKLDILVFGAHPDDVELGCGGTVIKEVQKGKRWVLLI